jgi:hypothetical protein
MKEQIVPDVPGWLTEREGGHLYEWARACPRDQAIVEIGAFKGKSTICLARGARDGSRAEVYSIDPHCGEDNDYVEYIRNLERAGVNDLVTPMVMPSADAAGRWRGSIGLLFIDGNHLYRFVRQDVQLWYPFLAAGGIIALHDTTAAIRHRMSGYCGPQVVADRCIFFSTSVASAGCVDTISYGRRGDVGVAAMATKMAVRGRKLPRDVVMWLNTLADASGAIGRVKKKMIGSI